jgi:O-antigen ligase
MQLLINISTGIYVFLVFNRVFVPFIDLRIIALPIFLILIIMKFLQFIQIKKLVFFGTKKIAYLLTLFIFIIAISNIKWYFNPYPPNTEVLSNVIILYTYNLFAILVFSLYWNKINIKLLINIFILSGLVLFVSIFLQYLGIKNLPFAGAVKGAVEDNFSLIGERFGGYAQDQNYATLGMVIWMLGSSIFLKNKFLIYIIYILSVIGILLSFSKTIIISIIIILSIFVAKKLKLLIPYILLIILFIIFTGYYMFELMSELSTMSIRFEMWKIAFESFLNNPFLGSGTTSVRSNFLYHGGWYVQPHNSIIALATDSGMFSLILFLLFFKLSFNLKNSFYNFLVAVLLFLTLTQELFVFQYLYFILAILPIIILLKQNKIYSIKIRI